MTQPVNRKNSLEIGQINHSPNPAFVPTTPKVPAQILPSSYHYNAVIQGKSELPENVFPYADRSEGKRSFTAIWVH